MKIESKKLQKIYISEIAKLDPISVILEDIEPGKGKIIIECYCTAWVAFWGGMGNRTLAKFFCDADVHYLAKKLTSIDSEIPDYDAISNDLNEEVEESTLQEFHCELMSVYGEYWNHSLPMKTNPKYKYLCRIILEVQDALRAMENMEVA